MFEALMPSLFLPEEKWGAGSWRENHPYTVDAQIDHGLNVAQCGVWGFSPSNTPEGGYGAYGVDAAGMDPNGMPSNEDGTLVDHGFAGCPGRNPQPDPPASAYSGHDTMYGDDGTDRLDGGDGSDIMNGGPGTDRLSGDLGADHAEGGGGGDKCVIDAADDATGDC